MRSLLANVVRVAFLPFSPTDVRRSVIRRAKTLVWGSVALLATIVVLAACSPAATPTPTTAPSTPSTNTAAATPTTAASPTTAATSSTPAASPAARSTPRPTAESDAKPTAGDGQALRYRIDPSQSEARYRVREQLAGRNAPNDAVGTTRAIEGELHLRPDGTFDEGSRIVVDLQTLRSDESRRDRFIAGNTLEVAQYPTAEFVPTEIRGLPVPLPTSGPVQFQIVGTMKLHGVEKEMVWDVDGTLTDEAFTGTAKTSFTFADFGMTQPRVAMVLSVEDNIRLEMDVVAQRVTA